MAFVTDSNRPQPLWQPPLTARLTASGAAFESLSLLMQPSQAPLHPPPLFAWTRGYMTPWGRGGPEDGSQGNGLLEACGCSDQGLTPPSWPGQGGGVLSLPPPPPLLEGPPPRCGVETRFPCPLQVQDGVPQ